MEGTATHILLIMDDNGWSVFRRVMCGRWFIVEKLLRNEICTRNQHVYVTIIIIIIY